MDDLDEFVTEHMRSFGLRLAWPERLALCESARGQSKVSAEDYVLARLRELSAVQAA